MGALQMFVTNDELSEIIKDFAQLRQLSGYWLDGQFYRRYNPMVHPLPDQGQIVNYPFYLVPPTKSDLPERLDKNLIQPRYDGWVSVQSGERVVHDDRNVLTMTTISAEDNQQSPVKAGSWVRALRKTLEKRINFGVIGKNFVYGGQRFYSNIGYSNAALTLLNTGILWMQYATDNSNFFPPSIGDLSTL